MFLAMSDEFIYTLTVYITVGIMVLLTVLYLLFAVFTDKDKKYRKFLFPDHDPKKAGKEELQSKQKNKNKVVHKRIPLREKIRLFLEKKGFAQKLDAMYFQAGHKDKHAEDFVIAEIKVTLIGIILSLGLFLLFNNVLLMLIGLILVFFPLINLKSEISERKGQFNKDFPYFLQTLAFVLKNGSNLSVAFEEVVNKQQDSVLKQVMLDVITAEKIEAGNFAKAFAVIPKQIDTEETREFIDIVQNQIEKGASVSDVFQKQSDLMNERFQIKQNKLIASSSTRIFLPLLMIMFGILLLFIDFGSLMG
jgi:Flp pilus assembly protein TadB